MLKSARFLSPIFPLILCFFAGPLHAQDPVPLPVKKVELYKNGIGYFEHFGTVEGSQDVKIALPSSRLNDILKSLTVLDLDGGRIGGVHYDSAEPLDRRLAEFPVGLGSNAGLVDFLNSIRGAGIEFQTPKGAVGGKLLGAEVKKRKDETGVVMDEIQVQIFTEAGEIRLVQPESIGAFKITDPELADDFGRYLTLLDTAHRRDVRNLRIETSGKGERHILIGYTSESPIWKTTYRIVLDPKEKPLLQGWAIVDNTTPMDWKDVSLSLVAGAPISFIQDLSQPVYARRPVIPLYQGVRVTPQLSEATLEERPLRESSPSTGTILSRDEVVDLPTVNNDVLGLVNIMGGVAPQSEERMSTRAPNFAGVDSRAIQIEQDGLSVNDVRYKSGINSNMNVNTAMAGEQFEYSIGRPVTIPRNESALLPIIQEHVRGEKVSLYNGTGANPRLAFWLENSSGLMLDGGPVTLIDTNALAGEGLIGTLQPGEKRLIGYALDTGTVIATNRKSSMNRVERVVINQGTIQMHTKMVVKNTYTIRNNNDAPRTVILEHPIRGEGKLVRPEPVETSSSYYRFRVEAKPKSNAELIVQEEYPKQTTTAVSSVTADQIAVWVSDQSIDHEIEASLETITDKMQEVSELKRKIEALDSEQKEIFRDQERIRSNIQRLGREPDESALRQRYVDKLNVQEDRFEAMSTDKEGLEAAREKAQKQLDDLIENLSLVKKFL